MQHADHLRKSKIGIARLANELKDKMQEMEGCYSDLATKQKEACNIGVPSRPGHAQGFGVFSLAAVYFFF